jgi:hypothetical protein
MNSSTRNDVLSNSDIFAGALVNHFFQNTNHCEHVRAIGKKVKHNQPVSKQDHIHIINFGVTVLASTIVPLTLCSDPSEPSSLVGPLYSLFVKTYNIPSTFHLILTTFPKA